jgi:hypothetical protein
MENLDWKDIANRAEWTFAQAFLATLAAAGTDYLDADVWVSAAVGAGAAVISLLKNVFVQARSGPEE